MENNSLKAAKLVTLLKNVLEQVDEKTLNEISNVLGGSEENTPENLDSVKQHLSAKEQLTLSKVLGTINKMIKT